MAPSPLHGSTAPPSTVPSDDDNTPHTSESSPPSSYAPSTPDKDQKDGFFPVVEGAGMPTEFPPLPVSIKPTEIDERDMGTPDQWVPRDQRMVRLTGKHPFNSEARLNTLYDAGFLTPTELFYVRSHGACPKVDGELLAGWKIEFSGLIANPMSFSIEDLKAKFEVVTLPITLVCAGNRRKEQNVVRKGLGFNWGAGGVSTALFTGVYLADVLDYLKPIKSATGQKPAHVIFEGADMLPQGFYGTSQTLGWARDKTRGMMIAWGMNGKLLEPDHGFPVRVVIPGQIGGRSVKWLTKVEISAEESQHYLHFWDNKLLPTQVMPEAARAEKKWWYDRKYIINELNTNSAIAYPDHNEVFDPKSRDQYVMKGYAYSGGGRRVNRIEISLDDGETWTLADITYPEDMYRAVTYEDDFYGKLDLTERETCYCWCFWSFPVESAKMDESSCLMVRAMDEGLSGQPRDMYWNATSMMNNWYFRVAIHHEDGKLRFEHPTLAGTAAGGWMERMKTEGKDILKPQFKPSVVEVAPPKPALPVDVSMVKEGVTRLISMEELKAHSGHDEPWFVVRGEVYDGTGFLRDHPGGEDSITLVAGEDATEDFMAIHSPQGKKQLAQFHIGTLALKDILEANKEEATIEPIFLSKTKWKKGKLAEMKVVSHDSRWYRFSLEREDQLLGLPCGQHVFIRLRRKTPEAQDPNGTLIVEGELVQRAYTPVSLQTAKGYIDLLIKLYLPGKNWPVGGKMTCGFNELEIGDEIEFKGPLGSFQWMGKGVANWRGVERKVRNIGLLCGGSGITPILQVLRGVLHDKEDTETNLWCIDANKTFEDILCYDELQELLEMGNGRFRLHHTLSSCPPDWKHSKGRMTKAMFEKHLPPASPDSLVLICGPDPMINDTAKPFLTQLGWDVPKQLVIF